MTEVEFHQKKVELIPEIISGITAESKLYDLLILYNSYDDIKTTDILLDAKNTHNALLKYFQEMLDYSVNFLTKEACSASGKIMCGLFISVDTWAV